MAETKITKNQVIPFLDISGTINGETHTPQWARIDRSTIFDLALNPNSQETDYISLEAPIEDVDKYKPNFRRKSRCIAVIKSMILSSRWSSICPSATQSACPR